MDVVQSLRAIVGNDGVLDAKETATRAAGVMRFDTLVAQALVRPKTTEQVSAVVRWCNDNGLRVVTHGGLTGLVHGADAGPGDVILSLDACARSEHRSAAAHATVQAGVVLQTLQEAVDAPIGVPARSRCARDRDARRQCSTQCRRQPVIRYGMCATWCSAWKLFWPTARSSRR